MLTSKQTIKWTCDACGKEEGPGEIIIPIRCEAMRPFLPDGWVQVGQTTYCPSHSIAVSIDGGEAVHIANERAVRIDGPPRDGDTHEPVVGRPEDA